MSVGVMKDYKLKQRDLGVSHTQKVTIGVLSGKALEYHREEPNPSPGGEEKGRGSHRP